MKKESVGRKHLVLVAGILLNAVAILLVVASVASAMRRFNQSSFDQNVENIKTLTDASANKVQLVMDKYAGELETAANYINNYQSTGMTEQELKSFMLSYYGDGADQWQLIDSTSTDPNKPNTESFSGIVLTDMAQPSVSYRVVYYDSLATVFCKASASTIGQVTYINEFTDVSSLQKSFAVSTCVRVLVPDEESGTLCDSYRTLMRIVRSADLNEIISSNNNISNLDFFNYTSVIIDRDGDYVFSNGDFQGTNFLRYLDAYNETMTKQQKTQLQTKLRSHATIDPCFFDNNKGQRCIYTISGIRGTNWYLVSAVPEESFHNVDPFSASYWPFFFSMVALFVIDLGFVLVINRQLRRRTREAQAANEAKSQFLSSMSHDIRTPMNAIIGMSVIAREALQKETLDRDTLTDCIRTIELSGGHLLTLINDILDISKIESGRLVLAPERFSLTDCIDEMLEIVQPEVSEKHFEFVVCDEGMNYETVWADELRINQICLNILSNAIKYTEPGGRITVELGEKMIPGRADGIEFFFKVSDTGIGMDKEFCRTIFDRFTRAVDTRINTIQGSGLGLSIVHQLVERLNGTITVESELNVGSVFTVTLPLQLAPSPQPPKLPEGKTALLIDSDPAVLGVARKLLQQAGMHVECSDNAASGLSLVQRASKNLPYDVILADWKLAEQGDTAFFEKLRTAAGNETKLVVMTGCGISQAERIVNGAAVNGYLTKPLFRLKTLHMLQSVLTEKPQPKLEQQNPQFDLRVLVAEDNPINRKVIGKVLDHFGVTVENAENGREAIDRVRESKMPYDLVLMDIQMPVMNGYDAAEGIRALADPARAGVPLYAMTADSFADDVAHCLRVGMDGHLSKPMEVDKLLRVLREVSEKKNKAAH